MMGGEQRARCERNGKYVEQREMDKEKCALMALQFMSESCFELKAFTEKLWFNGRNFNTFSAS